MAAAPDRVRLNSLATTMPCPPTLSPRSRVLSRFYGYPLSVILTLLIGSALAAVAWAWMFRQPPWVLYCAGYPAAVRAFGWANRSATISDRIHPRRYRALLTSKWAHLRTSVRLTFRRGSHFLPWLVGLMFQSSDRRENFGERHTLTEVHDSKTIFPKERWPSHVRLQLPVEMFKQRSASTMRPISRSTGPVWASKLEGEHLRVPSPAAQAQLDSRPAFLATQAPTMLRATFQVSLVRLGGYKTPPRP